MTHILAALLLSFQFSAPPSLTPVSVLPDDIKPTYRAHSPPECGNWRGARSGKDQESRLRLGVYRMWVLGYITGFNVTGPDKTGDLLGTAPHEEVYSAIDGYCARNPSHSVVDSMRPIAAAFIRRRVGSLTAVAPAAGEKRRAMVVQPSPCRDWVRGRDNAILRLAYVGMLRGYLTAHNRWSSDPAGDAIGADDEPLIENAIEDWCGKQPSSLLIGAVNPLIDHVKAERAEGRLPPGGLRPNEKFTPGSPAQP